MPDAKGVEALDKHLWTFNPNNFLPHGSAKTTKSDHKALQPVWLTCKDENPNEADVLILAQGASSEKIGEFDMCCEMLDGHDEAAVKEARERWKTYKEQGFEVTYWQQDQNGAWSKSS